MNKIKFYLAHPERKISSLNMVITNWDKEFRMASDIKDVVVNYWSTKKQEASECSAYEEDGAHINKRIENLETAAKSVIRDYELKNIIPSTDQLRKSIFEALNPDAPVVSKNDKIVSFMEKFTEDVTRAKNTKDRYTTTINLIKAYETFIGKKLSWSDIDMDFYNNFQKYMYGKDFSVNYFGDMIKNIKMFFHAAEDAKLHNIKLSKNFITVEEVSDSIYLSIDELIKLHNLKIDADLVLNKADPKIVNVTGNLERKVEALQNCRDMFLVGCFTALRFGDYSRLMPMKSTDKYITRVSEKVGLKTMIPMHYVISEILQKRNNELPPPISSQKLNDQLKDLCSYADINEPTEVTITKGGKKQRTVYPKWELVTTHTARRSGATNMLLSDIDIITIMSFTGHKTTKSFQKYVKASQEQLAKKAATNPYFRKKE